MAEIVAKIAWESVGEPSRLLLDYLASPRKGLPSFIDGVRPDRSSWETRPERGGVVGRRDESLWKSVADDVEGLSRKLGTREEILGKVRGAATGAASFVVTGQQPGTLGGPLHTAYKVATAIAVAARVEESTGRPVVPLYWCGSDDTDFGEIRQLSLLTDTFDPVSAAVAQSAHRSGMPVGDIPLSPLTTLWRIARDFVRGFRGAVWATSCVDAAFDAADDHGELAAATLVGLFGGRIAVVDGRMGCLRRCAQPVFREYVNDEDAVKRLVRGEGERLVKKGYHAQLAAGEDSGVFLIEGGLRKNVPAANRSLLEEAVANDVEKCSPGVVLRNLVQDYVFDPVCVVLGPAELAYRAQIGPLYEKFGIPRPAELPRMAATFVPPPLAALVDDSGGAAALVENPSAFARDCYGRSVPAGLEAAIADVKSGIAQTLEKFAAQAIDDLPSRTRQKIRARMGEVENRVDDLRRTAMEAGKVIALERWPFLGRVEQLIRPNGKAQERWLSSLFPFLYGSDATGGALTHLARTHVDELMDEHPQHIVYSCRS